MTATSWRPRVSIVIPVYNCEAYVRESLDSVLIQSYDEIEVVLVDDASTDGSIAAVADAVDGQRVRCLRNERNLGQFGTVNRGIAETHGELVAVHHADDLMLPGRLDRQVTWLSAHREAGAVFAMDVYIDPSGREFGRTILCEDFRDRELYGYREVLNGQLRYGNVFLRAATNLVRASLYAEVGPYSEEWGLRGDIEMWLRLSRAAPIGILDEPLAAYRWGHDNESARYERARVEPELTFELLDALLEVDGELAESGALRAFEARRAEDLLTVAVNRYVSSGDSSARAALAKARLRAILGSGQVRRPRLVVVWCALHVLVRLPRSGLVASALRRSYGRRPSRGSG